MWYIHAMEHYSAIEENKIMPFATTGMELEMLILSKVCSSLKQLGKTRQAVLLTKGPGGKPWVTWIPDPWSSPLPALVLNSSGKIEPVKPRTPHL